jgi:hypothetical protein
MANLSVVLSSTITVTDTTLSPSPTIVSRSLNNPTLAPTTVFYDPFFQALAGGSAVSLPAATCFWVYVKNLSGATNLTVAWTAVGAAGSSTMLLLPGGVFIYALPAETGGGFTALTLTGAAATVPADVLVAA